MLKKFANLFASKKAIALSIALCAIQGSGLDKDNITFYESFDNGIKADISQGSPNPIKEKGKNTLEPGKKGKALKLVNRRNWIAFQTKGNLNQKQGTIAFWISPENWDGAMQDVLQVLFHTSKGVEQLAIQNLWPRNSLFMAAFRHGKLMSNFPTGLQPAVDLNPERGGGTNFLKKGIWYHVIFTWKSGKITAYLNGEKQGELDSHKVKFNAIGKKFYLGWNPDEGKVFIDPGCAPKAMGIAKKPWTTLIDEFAIFNRFIYQAQAKGIYKMGALKYADLGKMDPMLLSAKFYPSSGKLKLQTILPSKSKGKLFLTVTDAKGNKIKEKILQVSYAQEEIKTIFVFNNLKDGKYKITAKLTHNEKINANSNPVEFEKKTYPWKDNKLGIKDIVLPPFTPIKIINAAKSEKIAVWNRVYEFNSSPFPVQITSNMHKLLPSPVNLFMSKNGKNISPIWNKMEFTKITPTKAHFEGVGSLGAYTLNATGRLEYDGMLWFDIKFIGKHDINISKLWLDIPLNRERCVLFNASCLRDYWFPKKSWSSNFKLNPYLWIGDEVGGISFFAESDQYWHSKDPEKVYEVIRTKKCGKIKVNFVNDPTAMPQSFKLSFGIMATPIKPRPKNWRSQSMEAPVLPWRLAEPEKFHNIEFHYNQWSLSPGWLIPREAKYAPKNKNTFAGWEVESKKYNQNSPLGHIPFSSLHFFGMRHYDTKDENNLLKEWRLFQHEWTKLPRDGFEKTPGWNQTNINPSKSFCDFFIYHLDWYLKNSNEMGIYFDGGVKSSSSNLDAGFGYIDKNGNIKPTFPILKGRELMRRIYALVHKQRPQKGLVLVYPGVTAIPPIMSFVDGHFEGESIVWTENAEKLKKGNGFYSAVYTEDFWRSMFNQKTLGLVPHLDLRLLQAFKSRKKWTYPQQIAREAYGLMIGHDIHSWNLCQGDGGMCQFLFRMLDWWGITDLNVKFLPYWDKPSAIQATTTPTGGKMKGLFASAYINREKKKMLIVALNTSNYSLTQKRFKKEHKLGSFLAINLKTLGLEGEKLKITDAESFGSLKIPIEKNIIPISLSAHQVKYINVEW